LVTRNAAYANIQEAPEYQTNEEERAFKESVQAGFRNSSLNDLGLTETQEITVQQCTTRLLGRHLSHPVHALAVDQAHFGGMFLPATSILFPNGHTIAGEALIWLFLFPFQ
jgi:hypothetical protein